MHPVRFHYASANYCHITEDLPIQFENTGHWLEFINDLCQKNDSIAQLASPLRWDDGTTDGLSATERQRIKMLWHMTTRYCILMNSILLVSIIAPTIIGQTKDLQFTVPICPSWQRAVERYGCAYNTIQPRNAGKDQASFEDPKEMGFSLPEPSA